jgi:invasion protein IalB
MGAKAGIPTPHANGSSGGGTTNISLPSISDTGLCLLPPAMSSNLASLVLTVSNATAGAQYDLFANEDLTNTNWFWVCRTATNETTIPVFNIPANLCFLRLGTMQDSDGDGITDAFAGCVGLGCAAELFPGLTVVNAMRQGRNLSVIGAVADTDGVAGLDVFTVLR